MKLAKGKVEGIIANLVIVRVLGEVFQSEICYIDLSGSRLMAEVIKIVSDKAYVQVFESTRGLQVGAEVDFAGHMLELTLGPGILSRIYDGLQNDLQNKEGLFIHRGDYTQPLNEDTLWEFTPLTVPGATHIAGDWLGEVIENWVKHKIMLPFCLKGEYQVVNIVKPGKYKIYDTIITLRDRDQKEIQLNMTQKWPVKLPIRAYLEKPRPFRLLETGIRVIDILNPMAEGGTGFIPGPFGCGKTVLQHALSKQADADIIIYTACGERANEVVELFTGFPELDDPRTGRKLMERTTIICNTSNMPVAAREASIYTGMTIAEYYRAMGLKVLLLADSTSRWAQALREMSNRMEELPGPDAFPMDLSSIISAFYSRAGLVYLNNHQIGSVTFIGTVSPAGGNLKEPVSESTKKAARCFYALSQNRADGKRYPAVDPLESYSKYLEYQEIQDYLYSKLSHLWLRWVTELRNWMHKGREAFDQINILGDDGVPIIYHINFWKSELIDFILLQQDAYDPIDRSTPVERQKYMVRWIVNLCQTDFHFDTIEEVSPYFKQAINILRQMNYSPFKSEAFTAFEYELKEIIKERKTF